MENKVLMKEILSIMNFMISFCDISELQKLTDMLASIPLIQYNEILLEFLLKSLEHLNLLSSYSRTNYRQISGKVRSISSTEIYKELSNKLVEFLLDLIGEFSLNQKFSSTLQKKAIDTFMDIVQYDENIKKYFEIIEMGMVNRSSFVPYSKLYKELIKYLPNNST